MRVVSGSARGLKLVAPIGEDTRPTLDRVKEAVFSMLSPYLYESTVLDAFAGSGALGIECLSRGASHVAFAECNQSALRCINTNLQNIKLMDKSTVYSGNVLDFIESYDGKFDIVFLDPPYESGLYKKALDAIHKNGILSDEGIIVAEWDYSKKPDFGDCFELIKEKKYGRVGISLLKRG